MGRPPCCDKVEVKKGPWTPEEDIILVSYIQQHGPSNWRFVPSNTGLRRCSKSCRLRWTNYLRPGIKRGNFSPQEKKMIIHLQALLGNRWAAMASYLPQRTDNDIKNYWNTHLKKKLKRQIEGQNGHYNNNQSSQDTSNNSNSNNSSSTSYNKGQWERRLQTDINMAKRALIDALSIDPEPDPRPNPQSGVYALSADNIARLLDNWITQKPLVDSGSGLTQTPKSPQESTQDSSTHTKTQLMGLGFGFRSESDLAQIPKSPQESTQDSSTHTKTQLMGLGFGFRSGSSPGDEASTPDHHRGYHDPILGFYSNSNISTEESKPSIEQMMMTSAEVIEDHALLSLIEKWLLEENNSDMSLNDDNDNSDVQLY